MYSRRNVVEGFTAEVWKGLREDGLLLCQEPASLLFERSNSRRQPSRGERSRGAEEGKEGEIAGYRQKSESRPFTPLTTQWDAGAKGNGSKQGHPSTASFRVLPLHRCVRCSRCSRVREESGEILEDQLQHSSRPSVLTILPAPARVAAAVSVAVPSACEPRS